MPLFFLGWEPGSDTYLSQDILYRSESCRRRFTRTAPCGPPEMTTQVRHELLLRQVIDEHAPIKEKYPKKKSPPYMNSNYRRTIYKARQAKNVFSRNKSAQNWQNYVKFRNLKTKVKRDSISVYFQERCGGGPKSKDFWPTIKPFLSQKSTKNQMSQFY